MLTSMDSRLRVLQRNSDDHVFPRSDGMDDFCRSRNLVKGEAMKADWPLLRNQLEIKTSDAGTEGPFVPPQPGHTMPLQYCESFIGLTKTNGIPLRGRK